MEYLVHTIFVLVGMDRVANLHRARLTHANIFSRVCQGPDKGSRSHCPSVFFVFLNTVIFTSACHVAHLAWSYTFPRLHSALRPLPLCSSFRTGHILVHHNQDSRLAVVANSLRSHFESRQDLASIVFTPRVSETASLCRASVADDLSDYARPGGTSQKTWWTCAVMSDHSLSSWYRDHSRTFVGRHLQREQRVCPQQVTSWRFLPFRQSHVCHSTLVVDHPHCMHDHLQKKKYRVLKQRWIKHGRSSKGCQRCSFF